MAAQQKVQIWANATAVRGYQTNVTFDPTIAEIDSGGSDDFDSPRVPPATLSAVISAPKTL